MWKSNYRKTHDTSWKSSKCKYLWIVGFPTIERELIYPVWNGLFLDNELTLKNRNELPYSKKYCRKPRRNWTREKKRIQALPLKFCPTSNEGTKLWKMSETNGMFIWSQIESLSFPKDATQGWRRQQAFHKLQEALSWTLQCIFK